MASVAGRLWLKSGFAPNQIEEIAPLSLGAQLRPLQLALYGIT